MSDYKLLGKDFVPPDITGKVTGRAKYAEDFRVDGMVYARMYTSPMAHGRVTNIDTSAAEAMDGVIGILSAIHCRCGAYDHYLNGVMRASGQNS